MATQDRTEQQAQTSQRDQDKPRQEQDKQEDGSVRYLRALFAELVGTFALTLIAAGTDVMAVVSKGEVGYASRLVAPGLMVMAMIYTLGNQSGAHINPAVTLAFALRRDFPWKKLPGYWVVQIAGAVLAALLLRALFGLADHVGATEPHQGAMPALIMETVLTFLLITVILGTATNHKLIGHNAAIAVGATVALGGLFGDPVSGASMNPARSLGPFLVSGQLGNAWIYIVGPLAGMLLAVIVAWLLRGGTTQEAAESAEGSQQKQSR